MSADMLNVTVSNAQGAILCLRPFASLADEPRLALHASCPDTQGQRYFWFSLSTKPSYFGLGNDLLRVAWVKRPLPSNPACTSLSRFVKYAVRHHLPSCLKLMRLYIAGI